MKKQTAPPRAPRSVVEPIFNKAMKTPKPKLAKQRSTRSAKPKLRHAARTAEAHMAVVSARPAKVTIRQVPSGVRGLDDILGGGIPELSFNLLAGSPGCGKTTLAHQIVFANATVQKPALYFTVLGEPVIKMLRYQQQHSFYDESKVGTAVRFINLSELVLEKDLNAVLAEIIKQVTAASPGIVVVDSFRTVVRSAMTGASELQMQ